MRRALYTIPLVFLAVLFLASAGSVQAQTSENVVLISVAKVEVPGALPGLCQVSGTVSDVWSGKAFHKGQAIVLPIPCGGDIRLVNPVTPVAVLADPKVLKASKTGVAHLSDAGALVWKETARGYHGMGPVSGYRIHDGVLQPLKQAAR
jgi:hypothetical protein